MQPIALDKNNTPRFKENKIVTFLLDNGPNDMNSLARIPFENNDREQFAQLIGYSVGGYCELSYVSNESKDIAEAMCLPENMGKSELELRNEVLRDNLNKLRSSMIEAITKVCDDNNIDLYSDNINQNCVITHF